jgi:hypothetical protein
MEGNMRKHEEWKHDKEFHSLLLSLNQALAVVKRVLPYLEEANADEVVKGVSLASHVARQEALLASDLYTAALIKKTRELYLLHGIDPSCLDASEVECQENIARRERYKANGYKGEW